MPDLRVKFMGLDLSSPIIVSSSSLTRTVKQVEHCERAGAGAVVLKSLFEEQIEADSHELDQSLSDGSHPEAMDYLVAELSKEYGTNYYLELIAGARKAVNIPIIASLNCTQIKWWRGFAKKIESSGADGLELNIAILPRSPEETPAEIENRYIEIIREIKSEVSIPVAIKLGAYFSSLPNFAMKLCQEGADALVLFNRFYQVDVDIDKFRYRAGKIYSSPEELYWSLRWIALLAGKIPCDLAANTGIHDGKAVIKQLLAGANAVEVASALFIHSVDYIKVMLEEISSYMNAHNFSTIEDFRGKLSQEKSNQPEYFERLQYIKALVGIE